MYSKLFAIGLLTLCALVAATPIPAADLSLGLYLDVRDGNTVEGGELPTVVKRLDTEGGTIPGPGRKRTTKRSANVEVEGGNIPSPVRRENTVEGGDIPPPIKRESGPKVPVGRR